MIGHRNLSGAVELHEFEIRMGRRANSWSVFARELLKANLDFMRVVFNEGEYGAWRRVMDAVDALEHVPVEIERLARERHGADADSVIADWVEEHAGIAADDALRYMGIVREMLIIVVIEERPMLGAITLRR